MTNKQFVKTHFDIPKTLKTFILIITFYYTMYNSIIKCVMKLLYIIKTFLILVNLHEIFQKKVILQRLIVLMTILVIKQHQTTKNSILPYFSRKVLKYILKYALRCVLSTQSDIEDCKRK